MKVKETCTACGSMFKVQGVKKKKAKKCLKIWRRHHRDMCDRLKEGRDGYLRSSG